MSYQTTSGSRPTLSESSARERNSELLDAAPESDDVLAVRSPSGSDASDEADGKDPFLGLSLPQLTGGALAAVVSAVAASTLGVAGTLVGAALGSVIVTVTAAAVNQGLTTAGTSLRSRGRSLAAAAPAATGRARPVTAVGGSTPTETVTTHRARRVLRLPLRRIWLAAAAVFAIAMLGLTLAEQVLGHPVSTSSSSGTTLGHVVNAPADTASESPKPSDSPAPTGSATDEATVPDGPASAPATGAPTQSADTPSAGVDTASPQEAPKGAPTGQAETPAGPGASAGGTVVP